jgi:hypothetical protein
LETPLEQSGVPINKKNLEGWLEPAYRQAGTDDKCLYLQFITQAIVDSYFMQSRDPLSQGSAMKTQADTKWQLVNDFAEYEYSSESFNEEGIKKYDSVHYLIFILIED